MAVGEQFGELEFGCYSIYDPQNANAYIEMEPSGVFLAEWR